MKFRRSFAFLLAISIMTVSLSVFSFAANTNILSASEALTYEKGSYKLAYRLYVPSDYDGSKSYPVLVFLHGAGERGNDNKSQFINAINELFTKGYSYLKDTIIIVPQCPTGEQWVNSSWTPGTYNFKKIKESKSLAAVVEILGGVCEKYNADRNRIYCTGLSMGGFGCWDLLCRHNDIFAAGFIMCGGVDTSMAEFLIDTPIWWTHGDADPTVDIAGEREMAKKMAELGGTKYRYDEIPGAQHGIWSNVCSTYEICPWLFSQKLSDRYPDMFKTKIELESESEIEVSGVQENENSVRFLGKVKTLDYYKVGFEYSENGSEYKDMGNTDTVYTNVYGGGKEYKIPEGEYAFCVKLDSSSLNGSITVRPYFIKNGNKTYGKEETVSFENGKIK